MLKCLLLLILPSTVVAQVSQNLTLQPGPAITLPVASNLSALAIADFNADSRGDIAVCQRGLNSIGVYLQTTTSSFPASANATYAAGNAPSGLVAASLSNLTSRPAYDLVAISGPSSRWTLLQNTSNGQGTFTTSTKTFGSGFISTNPQLATAYLNRDAYPDFAYTYDPAQMYELDWTGYFGGTSFSGGNSMPLSFVPPMFTMTDFDRDGYVDVVFPSPSTNMLWVIFAGAVSGSPYWYPSKQLVTPSCGGTQPVDVGIGDVNRDSQPDIAVANAGSQDIAILLSTGTYQFGSTSNYSLSAAPRRVLLEDLNGDGYPEMLTITADNKLQVFRHTGAAGFSRYGTPIQLATGTDPTILQVADMDGDGVKDIIVGCSGDNTVRVYLNRSLTALATTAPQLPGITVYPNPATDYLTVDVGTLREPLRATLLDVTGRLVRETILEPGDRRLSVADLPRGLYLLRLAGKSGTNVSRVALR